MKKKNERMVQAIVRIPGQYANLAKEIGKKELRSYSSVLRRAIIEWLDEYKRRGKR
jgi:Arc/MetJ-type ribon-helix-helix transcriptional regulator